MDNPPKASNPLPRYQMIRELGRNRVGGRITYLAKDNQTGQQVVIKQFMFAQSGSDWSGFKAYEREIQVLRGLDRPGIPRYLDSFKNAGGIASFAYRWLFRHISNIVSEFRGRSYWICSWGCN